MRKLLVLLAVLLGFGTPVGAQLYDWTPMRLSSPDFAQGGFMPQSLSYAERNLSPTLWISGVPELAQSLVLIMEDGDSPWGVVTHWVVWNIDPTRKELLQGSVPKCATEGVNDFGSNCYIGPCPPSGSHRYYFRLLALDVVLCLDPMATREKLEEAIAGHVMEQAVLLGRFRGEP